MGDRRNQTSKSQGPSSKETPGAKKKQLKRVAAGIEVWCLAFLWTLVIGICSLKPGAFHLPDSAIRYFLTNSSFNVTPRPGPSGTVIQPSLA